MIKIKILKNSATTQDKNCQLYSKAQRCAERE